MKNEKKKVLEQRNGRLFSAFCACEIRSKTDHIWIYMCLNVYLSARIGVSANTSALCGTHIWKHTWAHEFEIFLWTHCSRWAFEHVWRVKCSYIFILQKCLTLNMCPRHQKNRTKTTNRSRANQNVLSHVKTAVVSIQIGWCCVI